MRTSPHPLTPSLHYAPNSSLSKILWQRDSQPWPLKFPVMAACHPCIVELRRQGFRFHTVTTAPHTLRQTHSPHPETSLTAPCAVWVFEAGGVGMLGKHSVLKWVMWERPTWTIFPPRVFSTQLSLPPAAALEGWESEITALHFQPRWWSKGGSREVKLGCKEGRKGTKVTNGSCVPLNSVCPNL